MSVLLVRDQTHRGGPRAPAGMRNGKGLLGVVPGPCPQDFNSPGQGACEAPRCCDVHPRLNTRPPSGQSCLSQLVSHADTWKFLIHHQGHCWDAKQGGVRTHSSGVPLPGCSAPPGDGAGPARWDPSPAPYSKAQEGTPAALSTAALRCPAQHAGMWWHRCVPGPPAELCPRFEDKKHLLCGGSPGQAREVWEGRDHTQS